MLCTPLFAEMYVLVYWPDEDLTSIVRQTAVIAPPMAKQAVCCVCIVKVGQTKRHGRIAGIGKFTELLHITVHVHTTACIGLFGF